MLAHKHYGADLARAYRYWRENAHDDGRPAALRAMSYAREQLAQRAMIARFSSFTFDDAGYGSFAYADYESWSWSEIATAENNEPFTVRVLIGDDGWGVDWGDIEPSDDERENASAYYVALVVIDHDGGEILHDSIGGIDVVDLPGYLQRDWEDAAAYALIEYLDLDKALRVATTEAAERAHWAARGVVTVEC